MIEILDIEALAASAVHTEPWRWAYSENILPECDALTEKFPVAGMGPHAQRWVIEEDGRRRNAALAAADTERDLLRLGERTAHDPAGLDERWLALARDLLSSEYRDVISDLTHVDLRPLGVRAYFHLFDETYSCRPHIDEERERVVHLIYLDAGSSNGEESHYKIYNSGDRTDIHTALPPKANQSIIQVRTDRSWHAGGKGARKLIHITFEPVD